MIDMVRRHEIQVLRRAGHALAEIAKLVGVSQSTVQRIEAEDGVTSLETEAERARRRVGRPSIAESFRAFLVGELAKEPQLTWTRDRGIVDGRLREPCSADRITLHRRWFRMPVCRTGSRKEPGRVTPSEVGLEARSPPPPAVPRGAGSGRDSSADDGDGRVRGA